MGAAYRAYTNFGAVSGCSYYRQIAPLTQMEKMGLPIQVVLDDSTLQDQHVRASLFLESDFTLIYQGTGGNALSYMEVAKKFKAMQDAEGETRWPPTFIVDTDDDLFNVMPLNVTYGALGTRRWDGSELEDGDEIGVAHPLEIAPADVQSALNDLVASPLAGARGDWNGKRYVYGSDAQWHVYASLYRDGVNINISKNKEKMETWKKILHMAHLVTCATPRVADMLRREVSPDLPIFVTPNSVDFSAYPEIELREHPGEVRILWEGAASHQESLWPFCKSILNIAEKYPQVTWYFFGAPYKWAVKNLPSDRVKLISWVDFPSYKLRLSTLGHDINFAPLAPTTFNDSRSATRWYESSAICRPAATIAQKWGAYRDEIEEGKTGLLFETAEELEEKMGKLIENEQLRNELAANAKAWIQEHRDSKKVALRLFHKWAEVRELQKLTIPVETQEEKEQNAVPV